MKSSFCIDLQRFMLIPTKFPLSPCYRSAVKHLPHTTNRHQNHAKNVKKRKKTAENLQMTNIRRIFVAKNKKEHAKRY